MSRPTPIDGRWWLLPVAMLLALVVMFAPVLWSTVLAPVLAYVGHVIATTWAGCAALFPVLL